MGADAAILARLLRLEQASAVAYGAFGEGVVLRKPVADLAALLARQERAHAETLRSELARAGGTVPAPPRARDIEGLAAVRSEPDFLTFAIALENRTVRAYLEALQELESLRLVKTSATIMASEGQHLVVLRQALGASPTDAVPDAFETGTSPAPG